MIGRGLVYAIAPVLLLFILAGWGFINTPAGAEVPVHFGADGAPDRLGGRLEAFGLMPAIALGLCLLFMALPALDPRGANLRKSPAVLLTGWIGGLWILAAAQAAVTFTALGILDNGQGAARLIGLATAVLLIFLGNVLGKARPNWFVGIRTPWTLSSDKAWDVTHRWGGRMMVGVGLVSLVSFIGLPVNIGLSILISGSLGVTVIAVIISLWVWRHDRDRETYSEPEDPR